MYVGNTLLCTSASILSGVFWLVPLTTVWSGIVYTAAARHEEAFLRDKFGEAYSRYMTEVPRCFPRMVHCRDLGLINSNFHQTVVREIRRFLLLLPFLVKDYLLYIR